MPQLGLGPCTTNTILAGALRWKVTTVPRRFLGPCVEKRRRDARTLPVAPEELLLLVNVEEPPPWPLWPPPAPPEPEPCPPPGEPGSCTGAGGSGGGGGSGEIGR